MSACPSRAWTDRRSAPPSRRWLANEWRSACGKAAAEPRARARDPDDPPEGLAAEMRGRGRSRRALRDRRPGRAAGAPAPDMSSGPAARRPRSGPSAAGRACLGRRGSAPGGPRPPAGARRARTRAVPSRRAARASRDPARRGALASPGDSTSAVASRFESALGSRRGSRGVSRSAAGFSRSRLALRPNR